MTNVIADDPPFALGFEPPRCSSAGGQLRVRLDA
jgi:hypothetical protein